MFKLRREERWPALFVALIIFALNLLLFLRYGNVFTVYYFTTWGPFPTHFHVSGFDALTYTVVSNWNSFYTLCFRHPLLVPLLLPLYLINYGMYLLTGLNCVQWVLGVPIMLCAFYAYIYVRRFCRYILRLSSADATMFSLYGFSFAYVLVTSCVPDHFIFSYFLLVYTLFVSAWYLVRHECFPLVEEGVLLLLTAGVTLTNGLKTLLAGWLVNGRQFLSKRHLTMVAVVAALLVTSVELQYHLQVLPGQKARSEALAKVHYHPKPPKHKPKDGKPISYRGLWRLTDVTTPRLRTLTDNLFGESIQLHQDYLLCDVHPTRPVFVAYRHVWQYAVEALVVLLALAGVVAGRHSRLVWLMLSWAAVDAFINLVLGFGIDEVYIMSGHWIFLMPLLSAFTLKKAGRAVAVAVRCVTALLTTYLLVYNIWLIVTFMLTR